MTSKDRFLGCLLGAALGDAVGAPFEYLSQKLIYEEHVLDHHLQLAEAYGRLGAITDDTQMMLFTAEGLIRAYLRGAAKGITDHTGVTANAYLRWLRTQGESNPAEVNSSSPGWLYDHREFHAIRSPSNTCLTALREMKRLGQKAQNTSKGCANLTRLAPVGLFVARLPFEPDRLEKAFGLGCSLSALTHGHPTSILAGGAYSALILNLVEGIGLKESTLKVLSRLDSEKDKGEVQKALQSALDMQSSQEEPHLLLPELGLGWVAEEALSMAVYCALQPESVRRNLELATCHDGNSDSVGCLTGALLGAERGLESLPWDWLEPLEHRSLITQLGEDLYDYPTWRSSPRYPGC